MPTLTPDAILARDVPPTPFEVAFVADVLGETDPTAVDLCRAVYQRLGAFGTWRLLQKTLDVEARGGIWLADRGRRRTTGGVFFFLAKAWLHTEVLHVPPPRPAAPVPVPLADAVASLPDTLTRGVSTVKLTLIGTPGAIVDRTGYVAFKLTGPAPPTLPKGLPTARPEPLTWIVMVSQKQWAKVAESLQSDPTTKLICEGYPCQQGTAHVLLVSMCTTTAMQKAKVAAKEGAAV
jgi:PHAX RNA-binding domain